MYDIKTKTLIDRRELLKIKALSIVAEVKIIRQHEAKQAAFTKRRAIDPHLQREMYEHRKGLRGVSRLTHLARGFIKGMTLPQMENSPKNLLSEGDWTLIRKMVQKYGNLTAMQHCDAQREQYLGKQYLPNGELAPKAKKAKVKVAA